MSQAEYTQSRTLFIGLRLKLLLIFTILFTTTLVLVSWWFYNFATTLAMDNIRRDLTATAAVAAAGIDGDAHSQLFQSGALDDPTYQAISGFLRSVKRTNPKAAGIYTYAQQPGEPDQVHLVVSAALAPGEQPSASDLEAASKRPAGCEIRPENRPALGAPYGVANGMTPDMVRGLRETSADPEVYPDDWGEWLSGYAPIRNVKGDAVGAVGVDMCVADVSRVQSEVRNTLLPVFGFTFFVLALAIYVLADRITRPIVTLTSAADRIGHGEYEQNLSPLHSGRIRDEVETLAHVFEFMIAKVRQREETLKQQVAELQIMVDEGKRKKQVDEIVDSQFFRELQEKARQARARRAGSESGSSE